MQVIGVRELKDQATGILREVRERRAEYVITYHGQPVAALIPLGEAQADVKHQRTLAAVRPDDVLRVEMDSLRREIERSWRMDRSGVDLITEQRR
jgi:prevent-host-death family protein